MKKSIGSGRGSVYNILLKALQSGDKYGYEICKEVEEKTNGSYILKQPSLYSGLKRLETQGDITSYWRDSALGGRRHYYSLTEKGRERINDSNFSWTDARDDIVDTLFETSETDKKIESVASEIDNLKTVLKTDEKEQEVFENVFEKTEDLVDNSPTNSQADDLFSMFNNFDYNSNDDSKNEAESVEEKTEAEDLENLPNTEFEETEELVLTNSQNIEQDENENLNKSNSFDAEISKDGQTNLFSLFENSNVSKESKQENDEFILTNNLPEESNVENKVVEKAEEKLETSNNNKENFDEIMSNLQTVDNEEENRTATLQKNEQNVINDYFNSHISFGGFTDSTQLEKPEQNFSIYDDSVMKNLFSNDEEIEKTENIEQTVKSSDEKIEEKISESVDVKTDDNPIKEEEIVEDKENSSQNFDYRDIFGDLMSSDDKDDEIELKINETKNEENLVKNSQKEEELPRIDAKNDINRTLFFDSRIVDITSKTFENSSSVDIPTSSGDFEKYDQTPFETDGRNPFERYDSYTKPEKLDENSVESQQFVHTEYTPKSQNMSFDRKYVSESNNFDVPDYEVRYQKKLEPSKQTKFLSINKLNLITTSILFIFTYILITLTLVLSKKDIVLPGFQIAIYVISYVLGLGLFIKDFVRYVVNKDKKVHKLNTNEKINNFAWAIVIALLSVCINLVAGINFGKFAYFAGGFMIPIYFAIALVFKYPIKKFLSGFENLYK